MENIEKKGQKRERSSAYPAISLKQAIDFSQKLDRGFGKTGFSRENGVQVMGYTAITGTSASRLAALVQYGLVQRKSGSVYQNSVLSLRILHPVNEEDKQTAVIEAVRAPKLFSALLMAYEGQTLPAALENILIQNYGITRKAAKWVAEIFRESIEFAGLYPNGVITDSKEENTKNSSVDSHVSENVQGQQFASPATKVQGMQSIILPSGLMIFYPSEFGYKFAIGEFGNEIRALDLAFKKAKDDSLNHRSDNGKEA